MVLRFGFISEIADLGMSLQHAHASDYRSLQIVSNYAVMVQTLSNNNGENALFSSHRGT